jgi:hypothetical protein
VCPLHTHTPHTHTHTHTHTQHTPHTHTHTHTHTHLFPPSLRSAQTTLTSNRVRGLVRPTAANAHSQNTCGIQQVTRVSLATQRLFTFLCECSPWVGRPTFWPREKRVLSRLRPTPRRGFTRESGGVLSALHCPARNCRSQSTACNCPSLSIHCTQLPLSRACKKKRHSYTHTHLPMALSMLCTNLDYAP